MSKLRPYQLKAKQDVYAAWQAGNRNVLLVSPTGSGKTVTMGGITKEYPSGVAAIAHRAELVSQISLAMARENIRHRIIGPDSLRKDCVSIHMQELGRSLYDPGGRVGVCGVDTLVKKEVSHDSWFRNVGLWEQDEAHHVQKHNKWGAAAEMFPNAWGLGFTATPTRADGGGLGHDSDGLFHAMVEGPTMRELIEQGYLTGYRVFAPPSDVDYSSVTVTASGDLSPAKLRAVVHASDNFVGDVVKSYLKIAKGKRGITFAVDVESAQELAQAFRAAGVPAEVVSAKTDTLNRARILREFRDGKILQLVNVDLFGEGFDVPAVEVVSMARKTESYSLYCQQFGRVLRVLMNKDLYSRWDDFTDDERCAFILASSKPKGIIIDHVGNVIRHGLPDAYREWSLAPRSKGSKSFDDSIPLRSCPNPDADGAGTPCASVYERYLKICPHCGFYPEPAGRSSPEMVDGDLFELSPETLALMRGAVAAVDGAPKIPQFAGPAAAQGAYSYHARRQQTQGHLRHAIALWAGWKRDKGHNDSESYRMFFHTFKIDVMTACGLGNKEAGELLDRITEHLNKHGVIAA